MQNRPHSLFRLLLWSVLFLCLFDGRETASAQDCPTAADEIATDRPDVTNSSVVVPHGSLQPENGVDWTVSHGSNSLDGTNTRLRAELFTALSF